MKALCLLACLCFLGCSSAPNNKWKSPHPPSNPNANEYPPFEKAVPYSFVQDPLIDDLYSRGVPPSMQSDTSNVEEAIKQLDKDINSIEHREYVRKNGRVERKNNQ